MVAAAAVAHAAHLRPLNHSAAPQAAAAVVVAAAVAAFLGLATAVAFTVVVREDPAGV